MIKTKAISRFLLAVAVAGAVAVATDAYAGRPGGGDCAHAGIKCPMIWDPVICDDGVVYSNDCVARQHCAKGCVPYGGGPIEAGKAKPGGSKCPRDIQCADIWDPVICDDGQIYGNSCYAYRACATGCVPYGDDGPIELGGDKGTCERPRFCPELWAPVICDDGRVYANSCYAQKRCATGCVPYGEWLSVGGDKGTCDRPKFCPMLWAPVICDGGDIYPNPCYAQKHCATGCVPYGDLLAIDGKKKPGGGGGGGCPRDIQCPDIWDPVICSDGIVYSNGCYAFRECATGCVPYGDLLALDGKKKPGGGGGCPRDIQCPDIWDPVICSDGVVYSNGCDAFRACATGCVPYDDGGPIALGGN